MKKNDRSLEPQSRAVALIKEAQDARVKAHIRAILSQLKTRPPKPSSKAEQIRDMLKVRHEADVL
jgi:hypothetical protein